MEAVFLQGDGRLRPMFIKLIDAEILLKGRCVGILDHKEPTAVKLAKWQVTSLS